MSDSPVRSILLYLSSSDKDMTDVTEIEIQSVKHINTHLGKPL